jgi:8-amino-7-oxononanoate synthase
VRSAAHRIGELEQALLERRAAGLARSRRTLATAQGPRVVADGQPLLAFASNDYLGLANDPVVVAAARDGALRWGVGSGASHLVCGHLAPHEALERELAAFVAPCAGARALTFSSGYLANLAIVTALAGRGDAVFADRLDHACLNDGALLSRAQLVRYAHADADALARRLAASTAPRKLIVTDAVFSMDGDLAPLPRLLELADQYDAWLVVDDAHGFGVLGDGRGSLAECGVASARIVYMGTLGKAAGVAGAFVAAHPAVIETLLQTARPYIYTTAAPALLAEAARAALAVIRDDAPRRAHLHGMIARFRLGAHALPWPLMPSATAIQPLVVGDSAAAVELSRRLQERGVWVPAIRPPTVPAGTARLRVSLSAAHGAADVDALLAALRDCAP